MPIQRTWGSCTAALLLALASGARADWIQTVGIGEQPALLGGAVAAGSVGFSGFLWAAGLSIQGSL